MPTPRSWTAPTGGRQLMPARLPRVRAGAQPSIDTFAQPVEAGRRVARATREQSQRGTQHDSRRKIRRPRTLRGCPLALDQRLDLLGQITAKAAFAGRSATGT